MISNKKETTFLFVGDLFFFFLSLWLSLSIRLGEIPSLMTFRTHAEPFSIIFFVWIVVFYIAGLYDKPTLILRSRLPSVIFNAQVANAVIAGLFFYLFPFFGITPKTVLFICLIVSLLLIVLWRMYGSQIFVRAVKQPALLIGTGAEMRELYEEINSHDQYTINFVSAIDVNNLDAVDVQEDIVRRVYEEDIKFIVIDFSSDKIVPILPNLYNLIFSKVRFIDSHRIYEDAFNRIPLSLVTYSWFLENISLSPKFTYDFLKRVMDIVLSFILGVMSLVFYPFVYVAIKLDNRGKLFIFQNRIGHNNLPVRIVKFRTMSIDDGGVNGTSHQNEPDRKALVTRVGRFLRASRIDEFPQLWNVFRGDLSLIGPRPELPDLVKLYEKEIPFYDVRHLIKPGLSGWAQLYQKDAPKFATDYNQTKEKLSYDLFYIKNRSFVLDIKIALKTIKTMLSRSGL